MSVEVISERVDGLKKDVSRVESTVVSMDKKIDGLGESMLLLARLEERHAAVQTGIALNASATDRLTSRVAAIESRLPGLIETRSWIIAAVLTVVGIVGLAVIQPRLTRVAAMKKIEGFGPPAGEGLRAGIIDLATQPATAPSGPTPGWAAPPKGLA